MHLANFVLLLLGTFDWYSTRLMYSTKLIYETNPFMRHLLETGGFDLTKLGIHSAAYILFTVLIIWGDEQIRRWVAVGLMLVLAIYLYIAWNNGQIMLWWFFRNCETCPLI